MRKQIRRRRKTDWGAVLWTALVVNICVGAIFSPATAARRVRVQGLPEAYQARVQSSLQNLSGQPCAFADRTNVEWIAQVGDEVELASYQQNIFGRGLLSIAPRVAVAKVVGQESVYLSRSGKLFYCTTSHEGLPGLVPPPSAAGVNLTLLGGWDSRQIAMLCEMINRKLLKGSWIVELNARGVVSLYQNKKGRVILGSTSGLAEKMDTLKKVLNQSPDILSRYKELNLTAPENPVVLP